MTAVAARRCGTCLLNYPPAYMRCHVCGGQLDYMATADADADWQQEVARRFAPPHADEEAERIVTWRLIELLRAGYTLEAAEVIALRYYGPDAIDLHVAVDLLLGGCSVETALKILL